MLITFSDPISNPQLHHTRINRKHLPGPTFVTFNAAANLTRGKSNPGANLTRGQIIDVALNNSVVNNSVMKPHTMA